MKKKSCLYCYQELENTDIDFHPPCSRKLFDSPEPPELSISENQMLGMAEKIIQSHIAVTGVQPKLSLDIEPTGMSKKAKKFTIVGLLGGYILKPPSKHYQHLPEVEDLTMHLASICKINTVPHSLIRLQNGSLAYITKRIDRQKKNKLHMEDMCQLTDRLTEHKYDGSYEQIAKAILKYSANPVLDVINFYEQVLFSFLTGNADMHLKNFSLINLPGSGYVLAPAYDMVATALVNKADQEELALTLNAKKRKIKKADFLKAFALARLDQKVIDSIFAKMARSIPECKNFIRISFLPDEMKKELASLITAKTRQVLR